MKPIFSPVGAQDWRVPGHKPLGGSDTDFGLVVSLPAAFRATFQELYRVDCKRYVPLGFTWLEVLKKPSRWSSIPATPIIQEE